jgi:hypothetical protein
MSDSIMVAGLTIIGGLVFSLVGWLLVRMIRGVDLNVKRTTDSVTKLWEQHDTLSKDFYQMRGEHTVNHRR